MVKVVERDSIAELYTPYSKQFIDDIKSIGGSKWNPSKSCWTVPIAALDVAKNIMMRIYGEDGETKQPTLTIRIIIEETQYGEECGSYTLLGKTIARATGRDNGSSPGEDVIFENGKPTSGGSRNHWYAIVPQGSIIRINNVSMSLWEEFTSNEHEHDGIKTEIIDGKINRAALEAERAKLLNRVAEIDQILNGKFEN